jgi:hypothetical protein
MRRSRCRPRRLLPHPGHRPTTRQQGPRESPFYYFAYGAAVTEVEVDGLSGMKRVLRVDIVHDVGDSLNPAIDRGQIEGAFVQGLGWLTGEELKWDADGRLLTHSASTYQIPSIGDAPADFRVELLPAGRAARRHPRQQGRRRAPADARHLRPRGHPRRHRRVRGRGRRPEAPCCSRAPRPTRPFSRPFVAERGGDLATSG